MNKTKKILFLGGTGAMRDVVKLAKSKGIYTIVLDYYENSPAKRVADKSYLVSTMDVDEVLKIAREHAVDGVFTGFSDANLMPARKVADALDLPFYATEDQIKVTTDKIRFKETCRCYDIPVVPEYNVDASFREDDLSRITYPVIVKPADAWASKGVSICNNEKELRDAVTYAFNFSQNKRVIVEHYMAAFPDVCLYLNLQNGVLSLAAMCERDMNLVQKRKAMQPNALFYPCRFIPLYYEQLEEKLKKMTAGLGMRDGTLFIQCFVVDGIIMPFEMGYRLCGAQEYILCSAENGINSLEMLLNYSVTGTFSGWDAAKVNNPEFKHSDAILLMLLKTGRIARIEGLEKVKALPEVLRLIQFYNEGDVISVDNMGTLNQTFARAFVQCETPDHLLKTIETIQKTLKVYDENGEEMILPGYDCSKANILKVSDGK